MTHETLSALLDGECSSADLDRLLRAMDNDPRLKERYTRLCLAREAQHGTRIKTAHLDFSARVLDALAAEPDGEAATTGVSRVIPFKPRAFVAWWPLAGLAMAAGLAAMAVLVIKPQTAPETTPVIVEQAPAATSVATAENPAEIVEVADRRWAQLDQDNADQLNNYLLAYSQSRAQQGVGGTLAYTRFAAHTAEYRPQRIQGPHGAQSDSNR